MPLEGAVILQVIPDLGAGGAERTTIEVAAALSSAGARALVASRGGRLEADLEAAGGELIRLEAAGSKNPFAMARMAGVLAGLIEERGVSLVHARSRAPAWSALYAARRTHRPFVTTYHGIYNARGRLKRLYNSVMARGDVVIANSEYTAGHIRSEHPFASDRLTVIPRGVDVEAFSPGAVSRPRREAVLASWGGPFPEGDALLLLPARLTGWKGHRVAIAAAARLQQAGRKDWRMIFAGDAQGREDYRSELEASIAGLGLADRVHITGHCTDMPAALSLADVVLAPSTDPEAFGRVAAEAGAMGRIVIGSELGAQREVIDQGRTGFLCPPGDSLSIAQAILSCLDMTASERATMSLGAQERIRRRYTSDALKAATLAVYARLLGESGHA